MNNLFVDIVLFEENDRKDIEIILRRIWGTNPPFYPYGIEQLEGGRILRSTYLAKANDEVIGFCSIWHNRFHPFTIYFTIQVHPYFQNQGVGTKLLNYIQGINNDRLPLQTSLWETSFTGNKFLLNLDFKVIRKTYEPKLYLSIINGMYDETYSKDFTFINLSEINGVEERIEFIDLVKRSYEYTHSDNPPGEKSLEEWKRIIYMDTILEGSFIAKKNNKIVAFALLHENTSDSVDLGSRGVDTSLLEDEKQLIIALTQKQIDYASENKYLFMNAEIDTTDRWSSILLNYFPFETAPTWVTYQRKPINDA
jgi:GNAT superfamily N-acetyltransferase